MTLTYSAGSPLPFRWLVDELRQTPAGSLLGMVVTARPWLPRIGIPFMLHPLEEEG